MNTEQPGLGQTDAGNAWQSLISDINDPENLGVGDINYWVVLGGTGSVDQFVKNGGASIQHGGFVPHQPKTRTLANSEIRLLLPNRVRGTIADAPPTPPDMQGRHRAVPRSGARSHQR